MAPLPIIPNTIRCAFNWSASGQHAVNVMHFHSLGDNIDNLWSALDDKVSSDMWAVVADAASIVTVDLTALDGISPTVSKVPTAAGDWDGGTGGNFVVNAAEVVKFTTDRRGRSFRGRAFLPFIAEGAIDAGTITSGDLADQQTAWETFLSDMGGVNHALVIASYLQVEANEVDTVLCEPVLGTMRRRQTRLR